MAKNSDYLIDENDPALQNFERVERPPVQTSAGQPPEIVDRYQGGVVSGIGLQPDIINSQLPGSLPTYRLMPASIAGNPSTNAAIQSTAHKVSVEIVTEAIANIPAPAPSGGGSINGTVSSPFIPYASAPDTLSDSTWEFTPTGNVLSNAQTSSEISMVGAGNDIILGMNAGGSFPTYITVDDSAGSNFFVGLRPAFGEAIFNLSDAADDAFSVTCDAGTSVSIQDAAFDFIFIDADTNDTLIEMSTNLGGFAIWEMRASGASDFEFGDQGGSFAEIFQDGSGTTSYFLLEDSTTNNSLTVDINKGGTPGTVAVTLKSPAPSIFMGGASSPSITAGSGVPSSTPSAAGSIYLNSAGSLGSLLYVWTGSAWHNVA